MAENSKISWTNHTFNPWIGCTKVSPGCAHCYAETLMDTRYRRVRWGKGQPRSRTSPGNWQKVRSWNKQAARDGIRPRVFCASLADWLDEEVPIEWFVDLLDLIRTTPHLVWLLLSKRPQNWRPRLTAAFDACASNVRLTDTISIWIDCDIAPENVWVGTTVEDQQRADERIPALLSIPARVRFLSCEPMLERVDLGLLGTCNAELGLGYSAVANHIHWVICGGESGLGARPMADEFATDLLRQCKADGVAFWMKQMGGVTNSRHELADIPEPLRVRELPAAAGAENLLVADFCRARRYERK